MGTVKYSFGKERRQDSQTVYCTFPWFLGGLANVSWSCLTKENAPAPTHTQLFQSAGTQTHKFSSMLGKVHPSIL